jgi:hypothetical protein
MEQSKSNPNIMFASSGNKIFKSIDEGISWSNLTTGLPDRTITSIRIHPTDANIVLLTFSGFGTSKVYKSTNGGSNWFSIQGNLPDSPVNDLIIFTENTGFTNTYCAATDIGVFLTENNGTNWIEITDGLPNTVIMHLDYSPSTQMLRTGTHGRGVYETFISFDTPVELTSLTSLIEGFYNGSSMIPDTVRIELRNASSPYTIVDETQIFLDTNGQGTGRFYNAVNGTPYYIVVKHRSAVETWSNLPQTFTANSLSYDFTSASNKAYGNNLKLINGRWCIFGGDINQDGLVETSDLNQVFNDNVNGATGYISTDLNGDNFTEVEDLSIVFRNNILGVEKKTPP